MTSDTTFGYDVRLDLSLTSFNQQLARVSALDRTFRSNLPAGFLTGRARVRLSAATATFEVQNRITITANLAGSALIVTAPQHGLVPIEGTVAVTARVRVRDLPSSASGTVKEIIWDLTPDSLGFPRVVVAFPPGAPATTAGLQGLGITASQALLTWLETTIATQVRDTIVVQVQAVSLSPSGVPVSAPAGPFTPTQVDVRVIRDSTAAGRHALSVLLRTCRGPDSTLDPDLIKASAIPGASDGAVVVANWVLLMCAVCPGINTALGGSATFDPSFPCKLAAPVGVAMPGQPTFNITELEANVVGSQIVITGSFLKNTVLYKVEGTFEIDASLSLTTTAAGAPAVLATFTTKPVDAHVYFPAWAWIAAGVLLLGVIGVVATVIFLIVVEIARRIAEGPISEAFKTGLTGTLGASRSFPFGPAAIAFTPTSLALDDLTLGGSITLPAAPPAVPDLAITDNLGNTAYEIELAAQTEGTISSFQVTVRNRGTKAHNVTAIAVVGDPSNAVAVGQELGLPLTIPAGTFRTIAGTFSPPSPGDYLPLLQITTDDPSAPILEADIIARGVALGPHGRLTATPTTLGFGTVMMFDSSTLPITLTNVGDAPADITDLMLTGESPYGVFLLPWSWPTPIPAGQSRSLYVTFAPQPQESISQSAMAVLRIDVRGSTQFTQTLMVGLSGTGAAPRCEVDQPLLDFGSVAAGATATRTLTVRNVGDMPLEVLGLGRLSGQPDFVPDPAVTFPFTLAPTDSRAIDITWTAGPTPGAVDVNDFGVLSNDPIIPSVPFRCRGATAGPRIKVTPDFVEFAAPQAVPATAAVTIENQGSLALTVTRVRAPNAPFSLTGVPQVPFTVPAGGQVAISVVFSPTTQGNFTGSLEVRSDDAQHPRIVVGMHGVQ